eukprot:CAMPEP_0197041968 /NCGR_PEP_ID=MMETSP1384-20130603/18436_1 /TAXON_ID=29189 /ORGANISM="Ammonia sp." /LENGTH=287 /DNA_ID=CAMNT_0042472991 /DNA_START=252 /DNA_END=1112 /DNA_ORIENTATION=-
MDNLYLYNCTADDVWRVSSDARFGLHPGQIVAIMFAIICALLCMVGVYWCCKTHSTGKAQVEFSNNEHNDDEDGIDGGNIRSDSNAGLAKNASNRKTDFSPLQVDTPVGSETGDVDFADNESKKDRKDTGDDEEVEEEETRDVDDEDEDDDEKKEEAVQGIDNRRMSQQMVQAMQHDLDEWTKAIIADPVEAVRKYSRKSQTNEMSTDLKQAQMAFDALDATFETDIGGADEHKMGADVDIDSKQEVERAEEEPDSHDAEAVQDDEMNVHVENENPTDDPADKPAGW